MPEPDYYIGLVLSDSGRHHLVPISTWRLKTGSSNYLASFSDNQVILYPKKVRHKTLITDIVRQWATYFLPPKTTLRHNWKYLQDSLLLLAETSFQSRNWVTVQAA